MKIEVRNLKHLASLSEETHCFTATIYVDGKKAFEASNHGHGGCDDYRPIPPFTYDDIKKVDEWLTANKPADTSYGVTIEHSLEIEVGEQINAILQRRVLDRMLKNKIVVLGESKGQPALFTYPAKYKPTPANLLSVQASLAKKADGSLIVNNNAALYDRALALV